MAIERAAIVMPISRRVWLQQAGGAMALAATPWKTAHAGANPPARIAASWTSRRSPTDAHLGVLALRGTAARVIASIALPGRAHGIQVEADGSLLAVARRPGEWLLRWHPATRRTQWAAAGDDRAFTGHALASADGRWLYTPETDLANDLGVIGVRDARSLVKHDEWPTGGRDPHMLVWNARGQLLVANGGLLTRPESGRRKLDMAQMDSSLVAIEPAHGERLGQWRLPDPRLSIRHLAWSRGVEGEPVLGIALQAEHDHGEDRVRAPVLACFDGERLTLAAPGRAGDEDQPLAGYGGDIAGLPGGFAVSCTRAGGVGRWRSDGGWLGFVPLREACAIAPDADRAGLWLAGAEAARRWSNDAAAGVAADTHPPPTALGDLRLDNHWVAMR